MNEWNADGSYIAAQNEEDARAEFQNMHGTGPTGVRPWTDEDQECLDLDTDEDDYFEEKYGYPKKDSPYI